MGWNDDLPGAAPAATPQAPQGDGWESILQPVAAPPPPPPPPQALWTNNHMANTVKLNTGKLQDEDQTYHAAHDAAADYAQQMNEHYPGTLTPEMQQNYEEAARNKLNGQMFNEYKQRETDYLNSGLFGRRAHPREMLENADLFGGVQAINAWNYNNAASKIGTGQATSDAYQTVAAEHARAEYDAKNARPGSAQSVWDAAKKVPATVGEYLLMGGPGGQAGAGAGLGEKLMRNLLTGVAQTAIKLPTATASRAYAETKPGVFVDDNGEIQKTPGESFWNAFGKDAASDLITNVAFAQMGVFAPKEGGEGVKGWLKSTVGAVAASQGIKAVEHYVGLGGGGDIITQYKNAKTDQERKEALAGLATEVGIFGALEGGFHALAGPKPEQAGPAISAAERAARATGPFMPEEIGGRRAWGLDQARTPALGYRRDIIESGGPHIPEDIAARRAAGLDVPPGLPYRGGPPEKWTRAQPQQEPMPLPVHNATVDMATEYRQQGKSLADAGEAWSKIINGLRAAYARTPQMGNEAARDVIDTLHPANDVPGRRDSVERRLGLAIADHYFPPGSGRVLIGDTDVPAGQVRTDPKLLAAIEARKKLAMTQPPEAGKAPLGKAGKNPWGAFQPVFTVHTGLGGLFEGKPPEPPETTPPAGEPAEPKPPTPPGEPSAELPGWHQTYQEARTAGKTHPEAQAAADKANPDGQEWVHSGTKFTRAEGASADARANEFTDPKTGKKYIVEAQTSAKGTPSGGEHGGLILHAKDAETQERKGSVFFVQKAADKDDLFASNVSTKWGDAYETYQKAGLTDAEARAKADADHPRGMARALYDYATELGGRVVPSEEGQTDAGKKLWQQNAEQAKPGQGPPPEPEPEHTDEQRRQHLHDLVRAEGKYDPGKIEQAVRNSGAKTKADWLKYAKDRNLFTDSWPATLYAAHVADMQIEMDGEPLGLANKPESQVNEHDYNEVIAKAGLNADETHVLTERLQRRTMEDIRHDDPEMMNPRTKKPYSVGTIAAREKAALKKLAPDKQFTIHQILGLQDKADAIAFKLSKGRQLKPGELTMIGDDKGGGRQEIVDAADHLIDLLHKEWDLGTKEGPGKRAKRNPATEERKQEIINELNRLDEVRRGIKEGTWGQSDERQSDEPDAVHGESGGAVSPRDPNAPVVPPEAGGAGGNGADQGTGAGQAAPATAGGPANAPAAPQRGAAGGDVVGRTLSEKKAALRDRITALAQEFTGATPERKAEITAEHDELLKESRRLDVPVPAGYRRNAQNHYHELAQDETSRSAYAKTIAQYPDLEGRVSQEDFEAEKARVDARNAKNKEKNIANLGDRAVKQDQTMLSWVRDTFGGISAKSAKDAGQNVNEWKQALKSIFQGPGNKAGKGNLQEIVAHLNERLGGGGGHIDQPWDETRLLQAMADGSLHPFADTTKIGLDQAQKAAYDEHQQALQDAVKQIRDDPQDRDDIIASLKRQGRSDADIAAIIEEVQSKADEQGSQRGAQAAVEAVRGADESGAPAADDSFDPSKLEQLEPLSESESDSDEPPASEPQPGVSGSESNQPPPDQPPVGRDPNDPGSLGDEPGRGAGQRIDQAANGEVKRAQDDLEGKGKGFMGSETAAMPIDAETWKRIGRETADKIKRGWQAYRDFMGKLGGMIAPETTRLDEEVGNKLANVDGAENFGRRASIANIDHIMGPDSTSRADRVRLGAVRTERQLRYNKSVRQQDADNEVDPVKKKAMQDHVDKMYSVIGKIESDNMTEAEYQAALQDPKIQAQLKRWQEVEVPASNSRYIRAQGLDPALDPRSRYQIPGDPTNLKELQRGDAFADGRVYSPVGPEKEAEGPLGTLGGRGRGNITSQQARHYVFANEQTGLAGAYELDAGEMIANAWGRGERLAALADFYRTAEQNGVGTWGTQHQRVVDKDTGDRWKEIPNVRPPAGTQAAQKGQTSFFVHPDMYPETRQVLGLDEPLNIPGIKQVNALLTKASIGSGAEVLPHTRNIFTMLFKPGVSWNLLDLMKTGYGVVKDNPDVVNRIVELARIDAMKAEGLKRGAIESMFPGQVNNARLYSDPTYWMSRFLDVMDTTMRLHADKGFDNLVKYHDVEDTEGNRRDFVNQVGNYSKGTQNRVVVWLRDLGFGPFATAGANYWIQGLRSVPGIGEAFGGPAGVRSQSWRGEVTLRAESYAKMAAVLGSVAIANYLINKRVDGDDSTPLGAVKLGTSGGKTHYFDATNLIGLTRGLRASGMLAAMEGARKGQSRADTTDKATNDVLQSLIQPAFGPPGQFAWTAATGKNVFGTPIARKPEAGGSQAWQNLQAALKNANPAYAALAGVNRPEKTAAKMPLGERAQELLGPFGVRSTVSRSYAEQNALAAARRRRALGYR